MSNQSPPRLSVDIPQELKQRLNKLPWGTIKPLVITVLNDTLDVIEGPYGSQILGGILCGHIKVKKVLRRLRKDS